MALYNRSGTDNAVVSDIAVSSDDGAGSDPDVFPYPHSPVNKAFDDAVFPVFMIMVKYTYVGSDGCAVAYGDLIMADYYRIPVYEYIVAKQYPCSFFAGKINIGTALRSADLYAAASFCLYRHADPRSGKRDIRSPEP